MPQITIEQAIEDIKAGRMVILVDDEDRENEGDLTMAAEAVTPEAINFMAKYGRGLICLSLTTRLDGFDSRDPVRVILDARLSIDPFSKVFTQHSNAKTFVATSQKADSERYLLFKNRGIDLMVLPENGGMIDFACLLEALGKQGVISVLIEGGGSVIHSALTAGVVNKLYLFFAPKILGGDDGVPMCRGKGPELMKDALGLDGVEVERFDQDILVKGYINRGI